MPTIVIYIAIAAALIASGAGVGWWAASNACDARLLIIERQKSAELEARQQLLDAAAAENLALARANLELNDEVTSHAQHATEAAHRADAALRRDPVGLRIPAAACRADPVPTPADAAGVDHGSGSIGGVRLPAAIEGGLFGLALDAQLVRIKRDECRDWARGLKQLGTE